eukprot:1492631-Pleurochrysis_carterae.AAC.1
MDSQSESGCAIGDSISSAVAAPRQQPNVRVAQPPPHGRSNPASTVVFGLHVVFLLAKHLPASDWVHAADAERAVGVARERSAGVVASESVGFGESAYVTDDVPVGAHHEPVEFGEIGEAAKLGAFDFAMSVRAFTRIARATASSANVRVGTVFKNEELELLKAAQGRNGIHVIIGEDDGGCLALGAALGGDELAEFIVGPDIDTGYELVGAKVGGERFLRAACLLEALDGGELLLVLRCDRNGAKRAIVLTFVNAATHAESFANAD